MIMPTVQQFEKDSLDSGDLVLNHWFVKLLNSTVFSPWTHGCPNEVVQDTQYEILNFASAGYQLTFYNNRCDR